MTSAIQLHSQSDILATSKTLLDSGLLPKEIKTPQQAFAIITMGIELGLGMWQSLNGINVIFQRPSISGQLMLALIRRSGFLDNINISANEKEAIVTMRRKGEDAHTERFTFEDAKNLGLTNKDGYKKQPAVMLKWRAIASCSRIVFPDIIMGLYTSEEIAPDAVSVTNDGSMIYTAPVVTIERPADPAPVAQTPISPAPAADFEHRVITITQVRRVAIASGAPIWGMTGHDDTGATYRTSIESRKKLGDFESIGAAWDTTIGVVTEVNFKATLEYEVESNYWWFMGVSS